MREKGSVVQSSGQEGKTVSSELMLNGQQVEGELYVAAGGEVTSCGRLKTPWSGAAGAQEYHDEAVMLCKFLRDCPARLF